MWNHTSDIIPFMYIQKLKKKMNTAILVRVVPFLEDMG